MDNVNKVTLLGQLGQDPDLKILPNGSQVLNLRVATSRRFKGSNEQWSSVTEWHRVAMFGNRAESLVGMLSKGSTVYVEGELRTRSWEDDSGGKRYSTEVVASNVIPISRGSSNERFIEKAVKTEPKKENDDIPF